MSFPAISPLNADIKNLIEKTGHIDIAKSKPFIQLTKFVNGTDSIDYGSYTNFDLTKIQSYDERFPPIITGLECNLSGNLGTVMKAKINIKFASSNQLKKYSDFLKIGNCQMVSWGWLHSGSTWPGNTIGMAQDIVLNILKWRSYVEKYKYEVDMMAGLLINFDIKINDDLTVDVALELGSPAELPGYLAHNDKEKTSSTDSQDPGEELVSVVNALNLDGNLSGTSEAEIQNNSINHGFAASMLFSWGTTSDPYVKFGFVVDAVCNKFVKESATTNQLDARYNIDYAVGMAHPNMISCSENIVFPNPKTMNFTKSATANGRKITPDLVNTQPFGPFNDTGGDVKDVFPDHTYGNVGIPTLGTGDSIVWKYFDAGRAGYIRNIYINTTFLINAAKGCKTVNDFLEKIIAEINVASAGLMDLVLREMPDKNGKMVPSIADLNLVQEGAPEPPVLNISGDWSRVIGLEITGDMPKEVVGEMILQDNKSNADDNPGLKMFARVFPDPIMKVASPDTKTGGSELVVTPGWWTAAYNLITASFQNFFNLPGNTLIKFTPQGRLGEAGREFFGVFKDVSVLKSIYFPKNKSGKRYSLLPTTVRITVLGIAGIHVGSSFVFSDTNPPVPWLAKAQGFWQVTNIEHKVDTGKWETAIEAKFRPGSAT